MPFGPQNPPVRSVIAEHPLSVQRLSDDEVLLSVDLGSRLWAKLVQDYPETPDAKGVSRTAWEWRKQDPDAGGRFRDSDDGVKGYAAPVGTGPRFWPAFAASGEGEIGDVVELFAGARDARTDPAENYGVEWFFFKVSVATQDVPLILSHVAAVQTNGGVGEWFAWGNVAVANADLVPVAVQEVFWEGPGGSGGTFGVAGSSFSGYLGVGVPLGDYDFWAVSSDPVTAGVIKESERTRIKLVNFPPQICLHVEYTLVNGQPVGYTASGRVFDDHTGAAAGNIVAINGPGLPAATATVQPDGTFSVSYSGSVSGFSGKPVTASFTDFYGECDRVTAILP